MSILDLSGGDLDNTFEPEVLPKGEEAELRITGVSKDKNKNDNDYVMPWFEVVGQPRVKEVGDYMELPHGDMNEKQLNKAKLKLTSFFKAFGIDYSGEINLDECVGLTGFAILGMGKDMEDQPVNKVSKYVAGA
jgi:hypothetical protein